MPKISKNDLETLEILKDAELMKELRKSLEETKDGMSISWKKVKTAT